MNMREMAYWLREEHNKLNVLSAALQEKTAVVPRIHQQKWIDEVRQSFDHLRAHLTKHMALEECDGYMLPVVERRPMLSREVDRLAHEHGEMQRLLDSIHEDLGRLHVEDALLIRDAFRRIQNLLQYVEHHEKDENLMVMSTYGEDLGTED
jgi:hypothetical protein